jgi:hypothetical protein
MSEGYFHCLKCWVLFVFLVSPGETLDPAPEHALDVVKSEAVPYLCNRDLNLITRGNPSIAQDLL